MSKKLMLSRTFTVSDTSIKLDYYESDESRVSVVVSYKKIDTLGLDFAYIDTFYDFDAFHFFSHAVSGVDSSTYCLINNIFIFPDEFYYLISDFVREYEKGLLVF